MAYQTNYSGSRNTGYSSNNPPARSYSGFSSGYTLHCPLCGNSPEDSHLGKYHSSKSVNNLQIPTIKGAYL